MSSTRRNRFWMRGAIIVSLLLFLVFNTALLIAMHKDRLRRARLYEPKDIVVGIDVSHYQGVIDWDRVKNTQIRFAMIKATEGQNFIDSRFRDNWKALAVKGIIRGAYHFYRGLGKPDIEANHYIRTVSVGTDQ